MVYQILTRSQTNHSKHIKQQQQYIKLCTNFSKIDYFGVFNNNCRSYRQINVKIIMMLCSCMEYPFDHCPPVSWTGVVIVTSSSGTGIGGGVLV